MSDSVTQKVGTIGWIDLTVHDASAVRDFYSKVVGWESTDVSMGDYDDYCMQPPDADGPIAGICHARGGNADIPASWMMYITVADLDASVAQVTANGGEIIAGPRGEHAKDRYCFFRDPAGAVAALYQPGA